MKTSTQATLFPIEPWTVTETTFDPRSQSRSETIFAVANGYFGMRGAFEEGWSGEPDGSLSGTYVNGFYESAPIVYGEEAYGYAKQRQTMLNVPDATTVDLHIGGERFDLFTGRVLAFRRQIDMRRGVMTREVTWESASGRRVAIVCERLASLARTHIGAIRYRVTPLNFSGAITLCSALDGAVRNRVSDGDPRTGSAFAGQVLQLREAVASGAFAALRHETAGSRMALVSGVLHELDAAASEATERQAGQRLETRFTIEAAQGQTITLHKYIAYCASPDAEAYAELLTQAETALLDARLAGFDALMREQLDYLDAFWSAADIVIDGDDALQQGLRFNAFHLLQSAGRDSRTNIAAKGLTGEGYEGHYFWDTETYMLPFFQFAKPDIAKSLLLFRHRTLPKAKARAEELAFSGALYPWRTIAGEETSAHYPSGTAQLHINADIAYAIKQYVAATGDTEFLYGPGADMLMEIARFFQSAGCWIEGKGFCINGVTGPDEYTALVNNNAYTNLMVQDVFEYAASVARQLQAERPERWEALSQAAQISYTDVAAWRKAAAGMYVHRVRGLIGQDDGFLDLAVWDLPGTPKERFPLLLHYHPFVLYSRQVLKQADLVLAMYLQGKRFSSSEKQRNYDYYEPLTTHDSSLSACIHAIVAAELGRMPEAYEFFMQTARVDLDDLHGNTRDGVHCASMAGSYLAVVAGFAGMRLTDGELSFQPQLPHLWSGFRFPLRFKGSLIEVEVIADSTTYTLREGAPVPFRHLDKRYELQGRLTLPNRALKAVLFDLDGVITDTARHHFLAWQELAAELDIPFDEAFNERFKGVGRMDCIELLLEAGGLRRSPAEKALLVDRKNARYKQLIAEHGPHNILPGIPELLQQLRERGIRIALASASHNARTIVQSLGIESAFDVIVDGSGVQRGKPDPEIFLAAADLLQVPPRCCLGVEDAAAGVAALRAGGIARSGSGVLLHCLAPTISSPAQPSSASPSSKRYTYITRASRATRIPDGRIHRPSANRGRARIARSPAVGRGRICRRIRRYNSPRCEAGFG